MTIWKLLIDNIVTRLFPVPVMDTGY